MRKPNPLIAHLRRGQVYRAEEFAQWSNSFRRHLRELVAEGILKKLSGGLYYYPKKTVFGDAPADEERLIRTFLKDDRFLLTTPNIYNSLGVGTTQLYNKRVVYNNKRHGEFKLGNRDFSFQMKPNFPKKLTEEFLLVDLVNNLRFLAEEPEMVLKKVKQKARSMDPDKLRRNVVLYGGVKAKKVLMPVVEEKETLFDGYIIK